MKYNSIKAQVWRLILIPALSVSLMLAGTLTYLYVKQLNKFVSHRGGMLTQKMAHLSHYALRSGDDLRGWLETALRHGYMRTDAILFAQAMRHCDAAAIAALAGLAQALCGSAERHAETMDQGSAFAKAAAP